MKTLIITKGFLLPIRGKVQCELVNLSYSKLCRKTTDSVREKSREILWEIGIFNEVTSQIEDVLI